MNRFSDDIKRRLLVFYALKYPSKRKLQDEKIHDSLPEGPVNQMRFESYVQMIEGFPIFSDLGEPVLLLVVAQTASLQNSPGEHIALRQHTVKSSGDHHGDAASLKVPWKCWLSQSAPGLSA